MRENASAIVHPGFSLPGASTPEQGARKGKIRWGRRAASEFVGILEQRVKALGTQPELRTDFVKEMRRFLPAATVRDTIEKETYWECLVQIVGEQATKAITSIK